MFFTAYLSALSFYECMSVESVLTPAPNVLDKIEGAHRDFFMVTNAA